MALRVMADEAAGEFGAVPAHHLIEIDSVAPPPSFPRSSVHSRAVILSLSHWLSLGSGWAIVRLREAPLAPLGGCGGLDRPPAVLTAERMAPAAWEEGEAGPNLASLLPTRPRWHPDAAAVAGVVESGLGPVF